MTAPQLILASGSPRRRQLLDMLHIRFDVLVTDVDETIDNSWSPQETVQQLAQKKLEAACAALPPANHYVVIAADTIVCLDGHILGKPQNEADAVSTLRRLQGKTHTVYSGVAVADTRTGAKAIRYQMTSVQMRERDSSWIEWYVQTGEPMDKAGSYGIQGLGSLLVSGIHGDYYNVVGLPLTVLDESLEAVSHKLATWTDLKFIE